MILSPEPSSDKPIAVLPRWLLRHVVRAENHRHAQKKPKFFHESNGSYFNRGASHYNPAANYSHSHNHNYPMRVWDPVLSRYVDKSREDPLKDLEVQRLETNDYRLWAQIRWPTSDHSSNLVMARCRWCHTRFPIREFAQVRKTHKESCNFTHNLREVYQILLQRGQCTICNRHTTAQRWGVPLCGDECERAWMFAIDHSQRLGCAIIDARVAKRIHENETRVSGAHL